MIKGRIEDWGDGHIVMMSGRQATVTHELLMKEVRRAFRKYFKDSEYDNIDVAYTVWSADLDPMGWDYCVWRALWKFYDDNDPAVWIKENLMRHVK